MRRIIIVAIVVAVGAPQVLAAWALTIAAGGAPVPALEVAAFALVLAVRAALLSPAWASVGIGWRTPSIVVPLLALIVAAVHVRRTFSPGIVDAFLWLVTTWYLVATLRALRRGPAGDAVELMPPLEGTVYVFHGGPSAATNAHHRVDEQCHAVDMVVLRNGRRARGIFPLDLAAYETYGRELRAPMAGTIVDLVDGCPDMQPGVLGAGGGDPRGNYVVVAQDGLRVLLAHLLPGTIAVTVGQTVAAGAVVGLAGNSGNTSEPHVHVQANRGDDPVPIRFGPRVARRNDVIRSRSAEGARETAPKAAG